MAATLYTFEVRDIATIRSDMLRAQRNGLIARGVPSPNVTPDSDDYVRAEGLAKELTVVEANCVIKADEAMPDTATGEALANRAAPYGLTKKPAGGSVGAIVFASSAASLVPSGSLLTDASQLTYKVSSGGTSANGESIAIEAVSVGAATNHAAEDLLRWQSPPAYSSTDATVDVGGLVNGTDAETDEMFRARFFGVLQVPPNAGCNWSAVRVIAQNAHTSVQDGFIYPAIQGGATMHVAVTAAPTTTNKSRAVASTTMTAIVIPSISGELPSEHIALTTTTVTDVPTDVAFKLFIPDAPTASPAGLGGGWLDGTPWPSTGGSAAVKVTGVTSTTVITCDAPTPPVSGVSRVAWLSPYDWKLYTATVTGTVSGVPGAYVVTLDTPFIGIATGCYLWPQAENQAAYVAAVLAAFSLMGPGEKTTNVSALARGYRHPTSNAGWPYTLGAWMRKALTDVGDEVDAAEYILRYDGTTTLVGDTGVLTPQVPGVVTSPPNILIPRHIGFYRS